MASEVTISQCTADLRAFAAQMTDKQLGRSLRNTLRKIARRTRQVALRNLRATGIHFTPALGKTLRAGETRDARGIYVSARASKKTGTGMHRTQRGVLKPVLLWATDGTAPRETKGSRRRAAHSTGRMPSERFGGWLDSAERSEAPHFESDMAAELNRQVERQAKKHGFL